MTAIPTPASTNPPRALSMERLTHCAVSALNPLARVMLSLGFLTSGLGKLLSPSATAAYMQTGGLPDSHLLAIAVGVFEMLCGAGLLAGLKTRWAALLLAIFTVAASLLFHPYWTVAETQQAQQHLLFDKNVAIVGGLLLVMSLGGGPWSLDGRARRRDFVARLGYAPPRPWRPGAVSGACAKRKTR